MAEPSGLVPSRFSYCGDRARDLLGKHCAAGRRSNEDIDFQANEFGGQRGESLDLSCRVSLLDDDVVALHVSQLPKPLTKGSVPALVRLGIGIERKKPDTPNLSRLLRPGGKWCHDNK